MKTELEKVAVKSHIVMSCIALAFGMFAIYQQSVIQAAEFRAHVAEELLQKSQDTIVNNEVAN
jgi:hypothetical protein